MCVCLFIVFPPFPHFFRLNLCLGEGVNVAVGLYAVAVSARVPGSIKLYRETNKPVHSKTRTFHTQTGSLLLPSEMKKAQVRADWHGTAWLSTAASTTVHLELKVHHPSSRKMCVRSGVREETDRDGEG